MAAVSQLIEKTVTRFPRFARQEIIVHPLEKGGSDRKFYRMAFSEEHSMILAKYGRQREENRHYVAIARFLAGVGVRVPEIYFHDDEEGLIWMEDLGDRDLWSYRAEPWPVRRDLYHSALDQLLTLHTRAHLATPVEPPELQAEFNAELYRWEQNYFLENCLVRHFGLDADDVEEKCDRARLSEIATQLAELPRCYVHRDFQSQNIVIKDDTACFIDFQGMRPGLPQYDLASLLYDPYVRLPESERAELLQHYLDALTDFGQAPAADFAAVYDLCAMQRLMQALGAYGFLGHVKERAHFLEHIPGALASLREVLARIPGLDGLRAQLVVL
ncbi:MAG: phosphotransferase [Chthoniobacter sp.]|nr:phosphotransferase [Chthoniobacter sp.]